MADNKIESLVESQRAFFASGATLSVDFRINMLKRLREAVKLHEKDIAEALRLDLGKSDFEGYMCEVGMAISEISYMIKHCRRFSKDRRVRTPLAQFAAKSYQKPCPYGNVLIMSPWNYPFLLTVGPLSNALAAGNTAIVKPSAYSPATSELLACIIGEWFPHEYVAVVTGGRRENSALLDQKFDFVFFTGSQSVGKEVLRHTAEHLTPAVLELGGKSPCIVDESAKISLAAKRIVFGKYLNCGQTCVAPDYVLCHSSVKDKLLSEIITQIKAQYGDNFLKNENYGRIVNEKHFDRLCSYIGADKVAFGGEFDRERLQIQPTVMDGVTWSDAVMQDEIFGPILPILTYEDIDEVIFALEKKQKPLALYIFSESKKNVRKVTSRCRYGGGCVNDCIIHLATSEMGFGGVGESGMGAYHGKVGFDTFSHIKSIVDKKTFMDLPMRYQPYNSTTYAGLLRFFLK